MGGASYFSFERWMYELMGQPDIPGCPYTNCTGFHI